MNLIRNILFLLLISMGKTLYSQSNNCIDISNRIRYSIPSNRGGSLFISPVSPAINFFLGQTIDSNETWAIAGKTVLDEMVWAKKYKDPEGVLTYRNAKLLPDGGVIIHNNLLGNRPFSLVRLDENGEVLWAKMYEIPGTIKAMPNNQTSNSLAVYNGYIYFTTNFTTNRGRYQAIAKLDMDGNILWSRALVSSGRSGVMLNDPPNIVGNMVYVTSNIITEGKVIITKIDAISGEIIINYLLQTVPDVVAKGMDVIESKVFTDHSIILTGLITNVGRPGGYMSRSEAIPFLIIADKNNNILKSIYYTYTGSSRLDVHSSSSKFYINNNKETGFLLRDVDNSLDYSVVADSNGHIVRSRSFHRNFNTAGESFYHLNDDRASLYGFNYNDSKEMNVNFSRVSNFASSNSLDCFGRDTSVLKANHFSIIKDTFSWDEEYFNLVKSTSFKIITEPFTINEEITCSEISICDSIKIKGTTKFCLSAPDALFTLYKNSACMRKVYWIIDTTSMEISSHPNDTTINIKFLKSFHGYIYAGFEGCELKDSIFIDVSSPKQSLHLGNDTIFCPGKTITLNAGEGFKTYQWNDLSTNASYTVNKPGTYFVEAMDSCGRVFRDTILIKPMDESIKLHHSAPVCLYDTAFIYLNPQIKNHFWTPHNSALMEGNTIKLFPQHNTLFTISGEIFANCILSDTLLIKVIDCPVYFFIPNSFTPNNDGKNDIFKPVVIGNTVQYQFSVFNRYGQKIFHSRDPKGGWDGTIKGIQQDSGMYTWTCTYQFKNEKSHLKKGTVLLIR